MCENRKAKFNYHLHENYEAGIVLSGSEVKSLRAGKANLTDAYVDVYNEEAYLKQAHIEPYERGGYANHEPKRTRKLLLHKKEISYLMGRIQTKGQSVIPTKIYFKKGRAKIAFSLATGKKLHDKRETIKRRETDREMQRALKKV